MAREITPDDWPARLTDAQMAAVVGPKAFARGKRYADGTRVARLTVSGNGEIVSGQVRGTPGNIYETMAFLPPGAGPGNWSGSCSCPVGSNCKHTIALLLTARKQANAAPDPPGDVNWQDRLDRILHTRRADYRPVALEISSSSGSRNASRLSVRPLIAGKRGWIKQGISWGAVLDGSLETQVDPKAFACLNELAALDSSGYFYFSDSRLLLDALPARVWEVLRRAVDAGVTLTTAQRNGVPVRILPGLRAGMEVVRNRKDGTVEVSPAVDFSGVEGLERRKRSRPYPVGLPVHAYAVVRPDDGLDLLPLDPPPDERLGRLLHHSERITVPEADVARFERDYLPRIAGTLPIIALDPGLEMPEAGEPLVVLRVEVDADNHRARTSWAIRYVTAGGRGLGEVALGDLARVIEGPGPLADTPWAGLGDGWSAGRWNGAGGAAATGGAARADGAGGAVSDGEEGPTVRDRAAESHLAAAVVRACLPLAEEHGPLWRSADFEGMGTAKLVAEVLPALEGVEGLVVEVVGCTPDYREAEEAPLISTDVDEDDERVDWFSLRVRVKVGEEDVPVDRLMTAVAEGAKELLLDSGRWVDLASRPEIVRLARLMEEGRDLRDPDSGRAGDLAVTPFQAGIYDELVDLGVVGRATRRWREGVERLLAVVAAAQPGGSGAAGTTDAAGGDPVDVPAPEGLEAILRPYQLDGYRWLAFLRSAGLGGVLADDMGLGKTLQVLAVVQRMVERQAAGAGAAGDAAGPVLVVAPTSVVGAWAEQAARFCPQLRVRAVTRTRAKRGAELEELAADCDVVVTSYTIMRLEEDFAEVEWSWVVIDEAQFVKNRNSATYRAVRRLRTPSTVAITGTPLENSLMDLWSMLSITAPGLLPGPDRFAQVYRRPIDHGDPDALASLRARIRPFLLRRAKEDVATDLPGKTEQVLSVDLGSAHRRAYDRRLARERQKVLGLLEEDSAQARFTALRSLTILRQMALDPKLVEDGAGAGGSRGAAEGSGRGRRRRPSAKVEVLLETLGPVVAEGHRALVFSQFTRYLGGVREALEAEGMRTAYLDGSTTDRQEVIDAFRQGRADVFLISLKAGGFGLTLTEADYVFLLDPWWNPQAEEQAVDRAHRIGQDRPVMVYRLVATDTIEEKVMALKEKKADLFDRVVEGAGGQEDAGAAGGASAAGASRARLTAAEIRDLVGG